jgi:two-component system phosphate regulon sensor histidine kinase PhoR
MPTPQTRRRDIAVIAVIGAAALLVLNLIGALQLIEASLAAASIFALALIYLSITAPSPSTPDIKSVPTAGLPTASAAARLDRMIRENLPVSVLVIGQSGRIEQANPAARAFLGLGDREGLLSSVLRQPQVLDAVSLALQGRASDPVEYAVAASIDGHVRAIVTPLQLDHGPASGWRALLVLFDETSVKRAERMRADFLANASHELRTPLASIAGFIDTLRGHARDDRVAQDKFLSIMSEQTERMRRLIDDLLSLSRVEMNEHLPPDGRVDLAGVTADVLDFLGPQIADKSIQIQTGLEDALPVIGDRDQLTEVAQNLIENAIKYSPAGSTVRVEVETGVARNEAERPAKRLGEASARLTLSAPPTESGRRYVVFRVIDQGVGMTRQNLPRLTERFYRIDGQKSGAREGTGLGLAIVKHIINRHRGGFAVESAAGAGTMFCAFLPQAD